MSASSTFSTVLGERGRLVLPAPLRRQLGLQAGDRLILTIEQNGGFRVITARELAECTYGMFRHVAPERSAVDELIAERRAEAEREGRG